MGIIDWLAIVGAVTGTIGACWHLRKWWDERPHIDVKVAYALTGSMFTGPQHFICLSAINRGKRKIQLTGAGFEIEGRRNIWLTHSPLGMPEPGFPQWLEPGSQHTVYFSLPDLVQTLVGDNNGQPPRYVWFKDATDKTYKKAVNVKTFHSWVERAPKISG